MRRYLYTLLTVLLSTWGALGQPIAWADGPLKWSDFKAEPNRTGHKAETHTELTASYTADQDSLYFEVRCVFHPDRSWTKETNNDYLLNHEQRHFDLTEVYTRKLRKELTESNVTVRNYKRIFSDTFREVNRELYHMQQEYDKETRHSLFEDAQAKWDKLIDEALIEYADYTHPIIAFSW